MNFRFSVPDDVIQTLLTYPSCGVTSNKFEIKTFPEIKRLSASLEDSNSSLGRSAAGLRPNMPEPKFWPAQALKGTNALIFCN